MSLPQEMINKILYKHKGLQTPSAVAMSTLITQVQEDMDSFNENGKDINYYMTMLGIMKDSKPQDMWAHYLLGHMRHYGDLPDCWIKRWHDWECFNEGDENMCLDNQFPYEWEEAQEDPSILPDDPKDMDYPDPNDFI